MTITPSHIHGLALQLVAARFVEPLVPDEKLYEDTKLNKNKIYVWFRVDELKKRYRIRNDGLWDHFCFNC